MEPLYGTDSGEDRHTWSADQLLEDLREELEDAENSGLNGTAGFYAALIDYIEKHEPKDDAPLGFNPHSGAESGSWEDD